MSSGARRPSAPTGPRPWSCLPDLHFDLLGVNVGHDALAIRYVNERGRESTEVLLLDGDGFVVRGAGTYADPVGGG